MLQIVALYAFITSLASPQCDTDADCLPSTFCYEGMLSQSITGFSRACMSCAIAEYVGGEESEGPWGFLLDWQTASADDENFAKAANGTQCGESEHYSNKEGLSATSLVAMVLVSLTVGMYLAKEESGKKREE